MAAQSNAPVIIKRKKVVSGGSHHGGAWKVAIRVPLYGTGALCAVDFATLCVALRRRSDGYGSRTCPVCRATPSQGCELNG